MPEEINAAEKANEEVVVINNESPEAENGNQEAEPGADLDNLSKEELVERLKVAEEKKVNFGKLRNKTKEEKKELSQKEEDIAKRIADLEEREINSAKRRASSLLGVSGDEELKKKVEHHYNRLDPNGTVKDDDGIFQLYREAHLLATGSSGRIDPLARSNSRSINPMPAGAGPKTDIDPQLAKSMGLSADDIKKYSK